MSLEDREIESIRKEINAIIKLACSRCHYPESRCSYVRKYKEQRCEHYKFWFETLKTIQKHYIGFIGEDL